MSAAAAVQAYLRAVAARGRTVERAGPFALHLDPGSAHPYLNYAIPDTDAAPSAEDVLALVDRFAAAERTPRLEYLPELAPRVLDALAARDFAVQGRYPVMSCTPETARAVPPPDGVTFHLVGPDAPSEEIDALLASRAAAFGQPHDPAGAERFRTRAAETIEVMARREGEPVGGGGCQPIVDGTTELVGIGVREEHRGRGIGAALTAELARRAFAAGARSAFLTPGAPETARIYARAGFAGELEMLHVWIPPEPAAPPAPPTA